MAGWLGRDFLRSEIHNQFDCRRLLDRNVAALAPRRILSTYVAASAEHVQTVGSAGHRPPDVNDVISRVGEQPSVQRRSNRESEARARHHRLSVTTDLV
jgi:hypothetical protein